MVEARSTVYEDIDALLIAPSKDGSELIGTDKRILPRLTSKQVERLNDIYEVVYKSLWYIEAPGNTPGYFQKIYATVLRATLHQPQILGFLDNQFIEGFARTPDYLLDKHTSEEGESKIASLKAT